MHRSQLLRSRHESASPRPAPRVLAVDEALHALLGHADAPVRRVDDQRLPLDVPRLLQPARARAPRRGDDRLPRLPAQGLLLARQPLERRRRRVVPDPLEVRSAPGRARQLRFVRRETIRRPLRVRGGCRYGRRQQDHEPGRDEQARDSVHPFSSRSAQYRPRAAPERVVRSRMAAKPAEAPHHSGTTRAGCPVSMALLPPGL